MDIHQIPERMMGVIPADGGKGNAIALLCQCVAAGHGVKMPDRLIVPSKIRGIGRESPITACEVCARRAGQETAGRVGLYIKR